MKDLDVEVHEAGHALAAYYLGIPLKTVSVYSRDGEAGRCRFDGTGTASELDIATMAVAGRLAEHRALGFREAVNWFDDDDVDTTNAINMVDAIVEQGGFDGDVHAARHWIELRARSLLVTNWRAIRPLAEKLRVRVLLDADDVAKICKREGVRRHGELTKAEAMAKMTPAGRRALMGKVAPDGKNIEYRSTLYCARSVGRGGPADSRDRGAAHGGAW